MQKKQQMNSLYRQVRLILILNTVFLLCCSLSWSQEGVQPPGGLIREIISFEPNAIHFGTLEVGQTSVEILTFNNNTDRPIKISEIRLGLDIMNLTWPSQNNVSIPPATDHDIEFTFEPREPGGVEGSVEIFLDGIPNSVSIDISANVVPPPPVPLLSVGGQIKDNRQNPTTTELNGLTVRVTNLDTQATRETLTNNGGRYQVVFLNPAGNEDQSVAAFGHRLTIEVVGFETQFPRMKIELNAEHLRTKTLIANPTSRSVSGGTLTTQYGQPLILQLSRLGIADSEQNIRITDVTQGFNGGQTQITGLGKSVTFTPGRPGLDQFSFSFSDGIKTLEDNRVQVLVTPAELSFSNELPQEPIPAITGENVSFSVKVDITSSDLPQDQLIYEWDFGDGTTDVTNQPNIDHIFTKPKKAPYLVAVKVELRDNGILLSTTLNSQAQVFVRPTLPDKLESAGELKVSPQKLVAGQEANFSIGAVEIDPELAELGAEVVYNWKIGPETKTTDTPTEKYTFEEPGEYTVELTAILKLDEETVVSDAVSITVTVEPATPDQISFKTKPKDEKTEPGKSVIFQAQVEDSELADGISIIYQWDFGDGSEPSEGEQTEISHIYEEPGEYIVTVTARLSEGEVETVATANVSVIEKIKAKVTFKPLDESISKITEGLEISFSASAKGISEVLIYDWDFGDGGQESGENLTDVVYAYKKADDYVLTLTVSNEFGHSTEVKRKILVEDRKPQPAKSFRNFKGKEGEKITISMPFQDPEPLQYSWNFGDGSEILSGEDLSQVTYIYLDNGEFELSLTVTNVLGKDATITRKVVIENLNPEIEPLSEKEQQISKGETATFEVKATDPGEEDEIVKFIWNFGDGSDPLETTPSADGTSSATHVYDKKAGAFTARVNAFDDDGGQAKIVFFVKVAEGPIAEITELTSSQPGSEGQPITFSATVANAGDARLFYSWEFGDGEASGGIGQSSIEHIYQNEGIYNVSLMVSDTSSIEVEKTLDGVVIENVPPEIVAGGPYTAKEGGKVTLDASESIDVDKLTFSWDIGDGQTEVGPTVTYRAKKVGSNSVTLTVSDGTDQTTEEVIIEVENVEPKANAGGPYKGQAGTDILIDGASAKDPSDPNGEELSYSWDLDGDGSFEKTGKEVTFTPEEPGKFEIILQVEDSDGGKSTATAVVAVKAEDNIDPVAEDDSIDIEEDTPTAVLISVLDNDSDQNKNDVLTIATVGTPEFGTAEIVAEGTKVSYLINENADQNDSFTYSIDDGNGGLATATISVTVSPINDPPTAEDDNLTTLEDTELIINVASLLENDFDIEADLGTGKLEIKSVSPQSARGVKLSLGADGNIVYMPPENEFGQDSFTYTISDDKNATAGATVDIEVEEVNDVPEPTTDKANLPEDTKGFEIDVLFNDIDADGDELQVISVTQTINGNIEIGPNGLPVYTPNENYFSKEGEPDFFTYTVSDGNGGDSIGEVEVTVAPVNDLPVVEPLAVQTNEDEPVEITLIAEDPDEDPLEYKIDLKPENGELTGQGRDRVYTPAPNFFGPDRFSFIVNDGTSPSLPVEVSIAIESVPDPPVFTNIDGDDIGKTGEPVNIQFTVDNPDKTEISYDFQGLPEDAGATIRPTLDGASFTWLPKSAFAGDYTIDFTATSDGGEATESFPLIITQVNRPPSLVVSDIPSIDPEVNPVAEIPVTVTDPDADQKFSFNVRRFSKGPKPELGEPEYSVGEKGGTVANVKLSWEPGKEDLGKLTEFDITAEDDSLENPLSASAKFSIGVGSVNTPPKLILETLTYNVREALPAATEVDESSLLRISLKAEDAEKDPIKFEIEGAPEGAELTDLGDGTGTVIWAPPLDAGDGPEGFNILTMTVRVVEETRDDEKELLSDEKTVRIRVQNRNLIPLLSEIADQSVEEGQELIVDFIAGDKDEDPIQLAAEGLPPGAELVESAGDDNTVTGQIIWIPTFNDATEEPIVVTVTAKDPSGSTKEGQNSRNFKIEVANTNQPPIAVADVTAPEIEEGETLQFSVSFIDPDGDALTLALVEGPPGAELIDSGDGSGTFRWATDYQSYIQEGYKVVITATDAFGLDNTKEAPVEVYIQVKDKNQEPKFEPIKMPPQVIEGDVETVELKAIDPDDPEEPIQYKLRGNLPNGDVSVAGSQLLITPALGDQGQYELTLVAEDTAGGLDKVSVILTIATLNLRPEVSTIDPVYNGVVGDEISFSVTASDPNGDELAFTLDGKPDSAQFDTGPSTGNFSWKPAAGQEGQFDLKITVQEVDGEYKESLQTRLVVIKREGPILRNLKIDGKSNQAKISVELEVEQAASQISVALSVLTGTGEQLLYDTQTQGSQIIDFTWDTTSFGLDDITEYEIQAKAGDGVVENVVKIGPVIIDNLPPIIVLNQSGSIETGAGELVEISVGVDDNSQVKMVEFVSEAVKTILSPSEGAYQAKVVIPTDVIDKLKLAGITQGSLPYSISATDIAGNVTTLPGGSILILDKTPPVAIIASIPSDFAQGKEVEVDGGQSSDNSGRIAIYAWDIDDRNGVNLDTTIYNTKKVSFFPEKAGKFNITLRVKDEAGNEATATAAVEVLDNEAPQPPLLDSGIIDGPITDNSVQLTGIVTNVLGEPESEATVEISYEGPDSDTIKATGDKSGIFTLTLSGLIDGRYEIRGSAADISGNKSSVVFLTELVVDNTEPEVTIRGFGSTGISTSPDRDRDFGVLLDKVQFNRFSSDLDETGNKLPSIPVEISDVGGLETIEFKLLEGSVEVTLDGGSIRSVTSGVERFPDTVTPLRELIDGLAYSVSVTAADQAGNVGTGTYQFIINEAAADITPPQISFIIDDITADTRPQLKFDISDDLAGFNLSKPNSVEVTLTDPDGVAVSIDAPQISSTDKKSASVTVIPAVDLTDKAGNYQISVSTSDLNGNSQSADQSFIVLPEIDQNPVQSDRSRTLTEPVFATEPLTTISGSVPIENMPGGGNVEIFVNGNSVARSKIDENSGNFSVSVPLVEGINEVLLVTEDVLGRKGIPSNQGVFILDTQPPLIRSLEPANGVVLRQAAEIRAIVKDSTVAANKVSGVDSITLKVFLNDQLLTEVRGAEYDPISGQLLYPISAALEDGTQQIRVEVSDLQGNSTEARTEFIIDSGIEDTTPPTITGLSPGKGTLVNAAVISELTLRGAAYDVESGVDEIQIRLDGNIVSIQTRDQDEEIGEIAYQPNNLSEGEHTLTIYARDTVGNKQTVNATFLVDTTSQMPTLTIAGSEADINSQSYITKSNKVTLQGVAEPESKVNLTINGKPSGTTKSSTTGQFSLPDLSLIEGKNVILVTATDQANNISSPSPSLEILVDSRPPSAFAPQPAPDSRNKSQTATMSVKITDNPGGSGLDKDSIFFVLDGNVDIFDFTYDEESGTVSYTPTIELAEGEHFFRITATDFAGNPLTFNSGKFFIDLTPPDFVELLPTDGQKLSNDQLEVTAIVKATDLDQKMGLTGKLVKDGNEISAEAEVNLIKGSIRIKSEKPLVNGNYTATITAIDVAGNTVEKETNFTIDLGAVDETPPTFVQQFPPPGQPEIPIKNFNALQFQILDGDKGVDFDEMSVEINGVTYNDLFKPGSRHRLNRETGEVTLFIRFNRSQLELGGLEDPLELGALNRPMELAVGLNSVGITVPDISGNFGLFDFSFEVSLSSPDSPDFLSQVAPPAPPDALTLQMYTDFFINDIGVEPTTVVAGEVFNFEFNTDPKIVAAFLDLSTLDSKLLSADPSTDYKQPIEDLKADGLLPEWVTIDPEKDLEPIWTVLASLSEHLPSDINVDIMKLVPLAFLEADPRPFTVPAIANRYTAQLTINKDTNIAGGRYSTRLFVVKEREDASENETIVTNRFEVSSQEINIGFKNPALDEETKPPARKSRRGRSRSRRGSRNRQIVMAEDGTLVVQDSTFEETAYEVIINEKDGKIYTNSPEIPLTGQVPLSKNRSLMVEVFVNGNTMGIVEAKSDGTFTIDRIILENGENTVSAFTRSESKLQSPLSAPKTYVLDLESPTVDFIDLPNYSKDLAFTVKVKYQDNSLDTADFITLIVNNKPIAIDPAESETSKMDDLIKSVEVELVDGENQLVLTAIDTAGNASSIVKRTIIVDRLPPETTPTNLQAKLTFSGTEVKLDWQADPDSGSYNLYRSEKPILATELNRDDVSLLTTTTETTFVDTNVDPEVTYYYALTSVSPAGLEGVKVSINRNVTIISVNKGGTAILADGTRLRAGSQAIASDLTLFNAITIEDLSLGGLPPLTGALSDQAIVFSAATQSGQAFNDNFNQSVQVSLSYPTNIRQVDVYRLNLDLTQVRTGQPDGQWVKVASTTDIDDPNIQVESGLITFPANRYGIYGLAKPLTEPWDVNGDGQVDIFDLVLVVKYFAQTGDDISGDVNGDGQVDIFDLVLVVKHFGEVYSTVATAPAIASFQQPIRLHLSAEVTKTENQGLDQNICQITVQADMPESTLKGYQLDLAYDPYQLGIIDVSSKGKIPTSSDSLHPVYYPVQPKFGLGLVQNIAAVRIQNPQLDDRSERTRTILATISLRLKTETKQALETLSLQNLRIVNSDGQLVPVEIDSRIQLQVQEVNPPHQYTLEQNYPNPFNPETWLPYQLRETANVTLSIYDSKGQLVRQLQIGHQPAGTYASRDRAVYWDGKNELGESVASGIYYYQIQAESNSSSTWRKTRKMLLLK